MEEVLLAMRSGRLSFAEFERRTRPVWTNVAQKLLRSWRSPLAVSVDDVRQELIVHVWIFAGHWKKDLGVPLSRFVMFNAIDKAKKWLHQQRNAYRRDDRSPSRFDRPVSTLNLSEYAEEHLFDDIATAANQEEALTQREEMLAKAYDAEPEHRPALAALARTGDVELAAEYLHQSTPACLALGLESIADARHAVTKAIHSLA